MKLTDIANGTYASFHLSPASAKLLSDFCEDMHLSDAVEADDYHCTIIYSHAPCPEVAQEDFNLPCKAVPKGYKLLGTEVIVLVMELECPNAEFLHNRFMEKHGATHDYKEYIPHITLTKSYNGKVLPSELPPFDIIFNNFKVEEIEENK
jgi:hypothetical protein